jgi:uncharacterized protein YhbP (UPF0306 family)
MTITENSLARVRAFLADHTTLTLATIGPDGEPQAADLYYAETHDLTLYFVSTSGSRHAVNIAHDSRVAATIHVNSVWAVDAQGQDKSWRNIRGVQLEGKCVRVPAAARPMAWARYTAKYPFVLTDITLARALQKVDMYRISPHWLRWIDSSLGLGNNQEWVIADGEWHMVGIGLP